MACHKLELTEVVYSDHFSDSTKIVIQSVSSSTQSAATIEPFSLDSGRTKNSLSHSYQPDLSKPVQII